MKPRTESARGGFALILVVLVLAALFVLCAPFLMSARNASKSSTGLADRAQARLLLDSGARHAQATLSRSHSAVDTTPYFDSADELAVDSSFDPAFWNARDPNGTMWDVEAVDVAARIDWNSAPPQVFGNVLGAVTRSAAKFSAKDDALVVSSTSGFQPAGFVWIGRELVGYGAIEGTSFKKLVRGLGFAKDADGRALPCGPQPAYDHDPGELVIDQRAFAPALWRMSGGGGALRRLEDIAQISETSSAALAGRFSGEALAAFASLGSTYGGVRAGREWQRSARLATQVQGGTTCEIGVDEVRWFNPGTTIEIRDGSTIEFALVEEVLNDGRLRLAQALGADYFAYAAEVRPLSRRPVNVNTAGAAVLECLFANLQLRGVNDRITRSEAQALAALVVASRPFTGEEDFLRRVVLPAAGIEALPVDAPVVPEGLAKGDSLISVNDAIALYRNAHNANDVALAFSTMPLAYTSRDVYDLELRASVNAESGVERVRMARDEVDVFAPQQELMQVFARQEDFDQALRLDREAAWWATGPAPTSRWDGGASPPSRVRAHWGTVGGGLYVPGQTQDGSGAAIAPPGHTFASREDDGYAQLWASRVDEIGQRRGRVEHFDDETRDIEGRYLPDQVFEEAANSQRLNWSDAGTGFARAFSLSMWIKPRALSDGLFLDVGANSIESDRVTLGIEDTDLVLRVQDGAGDHPGTPDLEAGEVRFSVAPGDGPGLLGDTWSHVFLDVRGTRPDQMTLLVDGRDFGVRSMGLSRLAGPVSQDSSLIGVESGEGFPDQGVVRIGEELIEYVKQGPNALVAQRIEVGPNAGFGGRIAREQFDLSMTQGQIPGVNTGLGNAVSHVAGTAVALYGYSLPLASNVPSAASALQTALGPFAVGVVQSVVGGGTSLGDTVDLAFPPVILGTGMEGAASQVSGLVLRSPDPAMTLKQVMEAFSASGGYALVVQRSPDTYSSQQGSTSNWVSSQGTPLFGAEIVRYSGRDAAAGTLIIQQRAALPVGKNAQTRRGFVVDWGNVTVNGLDPDLQLEWEVFVVPISIPAPGAAGSAGFLIPSGASEFAQLTHVDQAELTEWVRYDQIVGNDLVRSEGSALTALYLALTHGNGGTFNGGGGPGGPNQFGQGGSTGGAAASSTAAAPPPASQGYGGSAWLPYLGVSEDDQYPVTRAAREAFQFRGVMATFSHAHEAGTPILPVFRVQQSDVSGGRPGRTDAVFLVDASPSDPGWPVVIQHSHIPFQFSYTPWQIAGDPMVPASSPQASAQPQVGMVLPAIYVALQQAAPVPIAAGTSGSNVPSHETRMLARMVKHPSGERPREVTRAVIGGSLRGGLVPSATVDELVFGSTTFGEGTPQGGALQGAGLVLTRAMSAGDNSCEFAPHAVRSARGIYGDPNAQFLDPLPDDTGLLRIGSEILAYDAIDATTGTVTLLPGGRGLLGTRAQPHEAGESATFLSALTVTQLANGVGAGNSSLAVEEIDEFPMSGTVLIGDELVHYTRLGRTSLDMPRLSQVPGKMDQLGGGVFRGRYGTVPAAHSAGDPVILFPFRYWDRWADRADGPELAYVGLDVDQPGAFWRSAFWNVESAGSQGSEVAVLQRLSPDVPWDADPENTPGLALLRDGMPNGTGNAIAAQADRAEWRVFVRYTPGAWDAATGLAHGWKQTPRLRMFGATYLAPQFLLRRVDE